MPYDCIPDVFPVLKGGGLTLREMREEDLPAWFARLSDPEAAALAGDPIATSIQAAVDGLAFHREAFRTKEGLRWSIVPDDVAASVGTIGFGTLDQANRKGAIGGAIGRAHWNRGIATAATRLVVDYGFSVLGLERIEAEAMAVNVGSIRVLERVGFQREGLLRGYRIVNGERADFVAYGLLRYDRDGAATYRG